MTEQGAENLFSVLNKIFISSSLRLRKHCSKKTQKIASSGQDTDIALTLLPAVGPHKNDTLRHEWRRGLRGPTSQS